MEYDKNLIIRELVDSILLNACSVNSAGLSLSLFVASGYLQDEQVEAKAFDLLQESLVAKQGDMTFENGLAGIGYTLFYLIENKFLEADFDKIFGEQYEEIIRSFSNIEKKPLRLINSLQIIYFLSKAASNIKKDNERLQEIIKRIFEGLELFLIIQFYDFADIRYVNDKTAVLNIYETYLKLVDCSGYKYFSNSLLNDYADLYRKGRLVSSVVAGFYLNILVNRYKIKGFADIIDDNIRNDIRNIYINALSLKQYFVIKSAMFKRQ
jgi:hypothetical protein